MIPPPTRFVEVARPPHVIVPVVVIVPPVIGQVVAMDETEAFDVLQLGQVTALVEFV